MRILTCGRSVCVIFQSKYREDGIRSLSQSFYSQLPDTAETQLARTASELQSEVRGPVSSFLDPAPFLLLGVSERDAD